MPSQEHDMIQTAASPNFPCQNCEVRDRSICSALNDEELLQLNKITTEVTLDANGIVFLEGDDSTYLFNIVAGAVRLSKSLPDGRRQVTGFLFPGDFLGLSIKDIYTYSAEAIVDSKLCRFERKRLTKLLEEFPKLEQRLLVLASNELAQAQDHLLILGQKTANERLATLLWKFAERIGQEVQNGYVFELPMNRADIGAYIGLTIETVSRTFTNLRNRGIIQVYDARHITIPDLDELIKVSGEL
jgi:CRP/FNR family transcriptional regulator